MTTELLAPLDISPDETTSSASTINVHPISDDMDLAQFRAWETLFERDQAAYSLQHPRFVLTECRSLKTSPLKPLMVSSQSQGKMVGAAVLLPKTIRTNQAGGLGPQWSLYGYRLAGNRVLLNDGRKDIEQRLFEKMLETVRSCRADFLLIEDLDQNEHLWDLVNTSLPAGYRLFAPNGYQSRLRIRFPSDGGEYWAQQFSSKTRSTFRRKLKKFSETRLERITRADQVPQFLAEAHEISRQTWQSRHLGLRIRNDDGERTTLTALADVGLLRSYLWYSDGEPAAFCVGNQAHGTFHYEEVGYATKFARFSPGQMLVIQMIEDLLAHDPPRMFDFGGGDADYKRMFANETSISGTVWVTPPSLKSRASLAWIHGCRSLKQTVRCVVTKFGLATKARQWIRYGGRKIDVKTDVGSTSDPGTEESST